MSANHIHISQLGTDVSTKRTYHACIMTHLAQNGDLATSELRDINLCRMSKGILFLSNIYNHQGTRLYKSAVNTDRTCNLIHDFNWPRRHHTKI